MTESDEIEEILYEAHELGIKDLVEDIAKYYEVGAADARSYIAVMTKEEIPIILSEMGKDEKEIKKLLK